MPLTTWTSGEIMSGLEVLRYDVYYGWSYHSYSMIFMRSNLKMNLRSVVKKVLMEMKSYEAFTKSKASKDEENKLFNMKSYSLTLNRCEESL